MSAHLKRFSNKYIDKLDAVFLQDRKNWHELESIYSAKESQFQGFSKVILTFFNFRGFF